MLIAMNRLGLAALICFAVVSVSFAGPNSSPESKDADDDEKIDDTMADMMLEMYENGSIRVPYAVAIHDKPKEGQFWKTRMVTKLDSFENTATELWQVVKLVGKQAIVENRTSYGGVVLAYQVDMTVVSDEIWKKGNVLKAWVGKSGQAPKDAQIMDKPEFDENATPPEAPASDSNSEDFKDLELAGGKWSGKKTSLKMSDGGGYVSTVWTADNGWFNKVVKMELTMEAGAITQELVKYGSKGKALLKWDGVKIEEIKAEAKPEKKEEKKDEGGKDTK